MTAAVYHNLPPLSVPPSQNTAPVLVFSCLYTHDVRKKAKKWQDGILRYHTFNKRVMVYDVSRNYVGDAHWTANEAVQSGDELTLEKGAIVEVGDGIGQTETDLTELRQSRKKAPTVNQGTPDRTATMLIAQRPSGPANLPRNKHRSLNALLGAAKGPIGKAQFPQQSPFEERQARQETDDQEREEGRPLKRACMGNAPAWTVTRTSKILKASEQHDPPLWAHTADAIEQRRKRALQPGQQRLGTIEWIELSDDDGSEPSTRFLPGLSSDALAPSSPPVKDNRRSAQKPSMRSSSPAFQAQLAQPPSRQKTGHQEQKTSHEKALPPPEEATAWPSILQSPGANRAGATKMSRCRSGVIDELSRPYNSPPPQPTKRQKAASSKTVHSLYLAAGVPKRKNTLLCQSQLTKNPRIVPSASTNDATTTDELYLTSERRPLRKTLNERLAEIDEKNNSTSLVRLNSLKPASNSIGLNSNKTIDVNSTIEAPCALDDRDDITMAYELSTNDSGALDRMMCPPAAPSGQQKGSSHNSSRSTRAPSPAPPPPPYREDRSFRRALSENPPQRCSISERVPRAPVRYTPTPSPTVSRESTPAFARAVLPTKITIEKRVAAGRMGKYRKPLNKSVSLNMTSNGTSAVILGKAFQAPAAPIKGKQPEQPKDLGPWSREAFDLFTWRPPNWDEEKWCEADAAKEINVTEVHDAGNPALPGLSGGAGLQDAV